MQTSLLATKKALRIAAVVVTYNRCEMLSNCLHSLLSQTIPLDRIFVIDNASSDGTFEFMHDGFIDSATIEYVRLSSNTGGAGGFNEGVKRAYNAEYDLIWLMDDDGCPDVDCLRLLLAYGSTFDVVGPLIVSSADAGLTSFPYWVDGKPCSKVKELVKFDFIDHVQPFNGILIRRKVAETIGFPDPRFFIWGDEENYLCRWREAGFKDFTLTCARFFHPVEKQKQRIILKWALAVVTIRDRQRKYLYYRNRFYNLLRYRGGIVKRTIKAVLSVLLIALYEPDSKVALLGLYDGLIGNFYRFNKTH